MSATLGIFVKHPVPGRVKTRLAAERGDQWAADLYAAFVADTLDRFHTTADRRFLCYAPSTAEAAHYFDGLARETVPDAPGVRDSACELWPQPEGSLGERLEAFFAMAFAAGSDRVVVIGSDSPTLPREYLEAAFERLNAGRSVPAAAARDWPLDSAPPAADCVLGPATDGGYYLVGFRGRCWPIFSGIEWSTPRVLAQTVARIAACGAALRLLPPWYDVDTPADVDFLRGHLAAYHAAGAGPCRTSAFLLREHSGYTLSGGPATKQAEST